MLRRVLSVGVAVSAVLPAHAALKMPGIFGDNMVLQAGSRTPIYGRTDPGAPVAVTLGSYRARTLAGRNGEWRVTLDTSKSRTPVTLDIRSGSDRVTYRNVLIGEVWLCSGQSNMEWSLHDAKLMRQAGPLPNPFKPQIRLFRVRHAVALIPLDDLRGKWEVCSERSVNSFSLLAYHFGENLQRRIEAPVGLIESDWGGTPAEAWTPRASLDANAHLRPLITSMVPVPTGAGRETPVKHKPEKAASVLYNGMIHPLMSYGFRGVTWFQGESNVGRAAEYRLLFPVMIQSWRQAAGRAFPFVFVQLANYGKRPPEPAPSDWAELREAQAAALNLPKTAMATAVDLANPTEIHWIKREELGRRLAWGALVKGYEMKAPLMGPTYKSHQVEGGAIRIQFDGKHNGLMMRGFNGLSGFEIAGDDKRFYRAQARIDRGTVVVTSPKVPEPVAVRYAWADDPETSLYNTAGLPALPFRTDRWAR